MFEEGLTLVEFICECGQRERVRIDATGYSVCYEGPIERDWARYPCTYHHDPRCVACRRYRRPAVQGFSGKSDGPTPPERAVDS